MSHPLDDGDYEMVPDEEVPEAVVNCARADFGRRSSRSETMWLERLSPMRASPGKWFRYRNPPESRSEAVNIRRGKMGGVKQGDFEAERYRDREGSWWLYIRYIGEEEDSVGEVDVEAG